LQVVIDIEGNGLKPTHIWCVVCKDIDTGKIYIFRDADEFKEFAKGVTKWIGHNILDYDAPVLANLFGVVLPFERITDTLILSKLVDYSRKGHSIEQYGEEFGLLKSKFSDWTKWSQELEDRCVQDVAITHKVYLKYLKVIQDKEWKRSIELEHKFQLIANSLHTNGFFFNKEKANKLLLRILKDLKALDDDILKEFPPREVLIREFTPKATKHGTISKSSVPRALHDRISDFEIGKTYRHTRTEDFNPASHKQLIAVLASSGWSPVDKTQTHIDTERELRRLRYGKEADGPVDLAGQVAILEGKLKSLQISGWKINETNLATLPATAPLPSRLLAKRILLESRRRTLTEWLGLLRDDGRIHGKFYGIGAWTHRMAHQNPNTANIPTDAKLHGAEMRALWQAPRNRLLVGVDAEGIQLRIFAHYIDDPEFTKALVEGKKDDKTDPHSLNQRVIGAKSRNIAKRFIFAYLLGAGVGKLAQILEVSERDARDSLDRLLERYAGLALLKETVIPTDAKRGYFRGVDGRLVKIPGETAGERKHLCMSGYLQNGEAVVMKAACLKWHDKLAKDNAILVNFVHDEWQTECPNDMEVAVKIAKMQADSLREVGEEFKLKCPLAGSYWNDDLKDYTIGTNWKVTH
jgi:DNA polymerase-1